MSICKNQKNLPIILLNYTLRLLEAAKVSVLGLWTMSSKHANSLMFVWGVGGFVVVGREMIHWKFIHNGQLLSVDQSNIIETEYKGNSARPIRLGSLLINMRTKTAIDTVSNRSFQVQRALQIGDFTPNLCLLQHEAATAKKTATVTVITVKDVIFSFSNLATEGYLIPPGFEERFEGIPRGDAIVEKISVTLPQTVSREGLGSSYSERMYGWVWDKLTDRDTNPTPAAPGIQLRNIIFVNNPSMMQRFRTAVEILDVTNEWPSGTEASMLESVCSEHEFFFSLKTRIALMMHATDDYRERIILSCGFSTELNGDDNGYRKGIEFTTYANYAISKLQQEGRMHGMGNLCITFAWVAIGKPHFTQLVRTDRPATCTTVFGLTQNGVEDSKGNTPILVSFEPELCCPFAVAEFDIRPV